MNSQTAKDITGFRSYLPDALRLRFDEQLSVRAIALQLGLSHSTIHNLFQRFNASGITWPLPESLSVAQLDAILYANRKKELPDDPQISESTWRKERRTSYSREFKIRLVKQALQPGAVVARILVSKYMEHIPLYRQSEIYARQGVELSRNTMVRWVSEMADKLRPLYIALNDYVLEAGKVHADDTPVKVLAPGNGKTKTGRL
ncbi:IS66 family insertion sequence hypothetical protein [Escherichia coli]|nr:IS66 family insertion sequence hypothetical protein [Escherichia coli]EFW7478239.1 IS66 family insertion sequence element accessory protein TnpB [Shigella sonnei]EFA5486271.1 IS66 family insertion sequence hypothetical protein [Escherichia coli]EFC1842402.1 IS66 family insertion sequence element accessory protein TnpB [Escherichia coli]EFC2091137.1 IS66 family insertion sequence element accessory protein TnpB [Escherichia coli]